MHRRAVLGGLLGLLGSSRLDSAEVDDGPVRRWIERARSLKSITADFRQERHLRAVTRPLVTSGRIWYRADGALRWQLGDPPKLIALRQASGADMRVVEPLARVVRLFSAEDAGQKGGALALLDAGFPESYAAFENRFRLDKVDGDEAGGWRVTARLQDNALSVAVQRMVFVIGGGSSQLLGLEVWLRDGSKIVNLFSNVKENDLVPDSLFQETTDGFRELK